MSDWLKNRILLAYELWAVFTRDGDVLTRAWRAHAMRWIVVPVGSGILMGHLNGPSLEYFAWWSPIVFIALVVAALAYGLFVQTPMPEPYRAPLFALGFAVGILCWSGRP